MVEYFAVAKHIKLTAVSVSFTKHSTVKIKKTSYSPQEALGWIHGVNKLSQLQCNYKKTYTKM